MTPAGGGMRLLFVCADMRIGGAERQWASLLPALAARGARPALLALAEEGPLFDEVRSAGVPAEYAGMRRRSDLAGLRRALAFARGRADAVVTRGVSAQLVGALMARRARVPLVLNEHTPCTPDGRLLPMRLHQRLLTRAVAPRVDRVIAVTSAQVPGLARLGYRRERIEVVRNGVAPDGLVPSRPREEVRGELGLEDGDFSALLVSGLRPEKRVDTFVEAVGVARRSDGRVQGLVAGGGPELQRVRRLVAGGGGGVRLLGERRDVPDLMAAADVVCLTSQAEALPMSVLEAMALARPVVATQVGGMAEAVVPGQTGELVPPGDAGSVAGAILALAADPERARRLGEAGRARQRDRFDGAGMVDGYLRVLEAAAG